VFHLINNNIMSGSLLEGFSNVSQGDVGMAMQVAKVLPAIVNFSQANKAKKQEKEYLGKIKELEENRQAIPNPYVNIKNPYANLAVATQAARIKAEETDKALANTLDTLRETGASAGGATALAQAAAKSKQEVSAGIEKQEMANEVLRAKGEMAVMQADASGKIFTFKAQEDRDNVQLDRLQSLANLEAQRRQQGQAVGIGSVMSGLKGASGLIKPQGGSNTISGNEMSFLDNSPISNPEYGFGNVPDGTIYGNDQFGNEMSFAPGTEIGG
jgi:hypothetical protein